MLPRWLYELLPYVYLAVGSLSVFRLETLLGRLSGLLLVSAGMLIWGLRVNYRMEQRGRARYKYPHQLHPRQRKSPRAEETEEEEEI